MPLNSSGFKCAKDENRLKYLLIPDRLGFHQCLKFSDGSGGCNGCLNNHGMGLENRHNCTDDVWTLSNLTINSLIF